MHAIVALLSTWVLKDGDKQQVFCNFERGCFELSAELLTCAVKFVDHKKGKGSEE